VSSHDSTRTVRALFAHTHGATDRDRPTDRIARLSTARRATTALARAPKNDRVDDRIDDARSRNAPTRHARHGGRRRRGMERDEGV
jgi:hypothetical protein